MGTSIMTEICTSIPIPNWKSRGFPISILIPS